MSRQIQGSMTRKNETLVHHAHLTRMQIMRTAVQQAFTLTHNKYEPHNFHQFRNEHKCLELSNAKVQCKGLQGIFKDLIHLNSETVYFFVTWHMHWFKWYKIVYFLYINLQ